MHKDEVTGAGKDVAGKVKEGVGKATGDEQLRSEGVGDQAAGKVEKGVGNLKEAARDILKK